MNIKTINMKKLKEFYSNRTRIEQDIIAGAIFGMMNVFMAYSVIYIILYSNQLYQAYRLFISWLS